MSGSSDSHTIGAKTFADVITDSIVTRTGQPVTVDSSTVRVLLTTEVYKPTTHLNETTHGAVLYAVNGEML